MGIWCQKRRAIGLSVGARWKSVRGRWKLQRAQRISSEGDSREPQTMQERGEIKSSRRCQKLIGFIGKFFGNVVGDVETLADDLEVEASGEGEAHELLVELVVGGRTDGPALLL